MQMPGPGSSSWLTASARGTASDRWHRRLVFLRNFFKHPRMVGSFLQSSPPLVERLLGEVDWGRARVVVEFGPGVGTVTTGILCCMYPWARLLAIETNAEFASLLRATIADRRVYVVHGKALDVPRLLAEHDLPRADVIISGIPFSTLPARERSETLRAAYAALQPGGQLVVYQYSRKVLQDLLQLFGHVEQAVEWRNGLPMQVFACRKTRSFRSSAAPRGVA